MNLTDLHLTVQIAESAMTALAIGVAGCWAWYRFVRGREHVWNLDVSIRHESQVCSEQRLLTLYIDLANLGKVDVEPGRRGCEVCLARLPQEMTPGSVLNWADGTPVVERHDVIARRFDADGPSGYLIEPEASYTEVLNVSVEPGLYMARARFWWRDDRDCITQYVTLCVA